MSDGVGGPAGAILLAGPDPEDGCRWQPDQVYAMENVSLLSVRRR